MKGFLLGSSTGAFLGIAVLSGDPIISLIAAYGVVASTIGFWGFLD